MTPLTEDQKRISKLIHDWMDKQESQNNEIGVASLRTLAEMILELVEKTKRYYPEK